MKMIKYLFGFLIRPKSRLELMFIEQENQRLEFYNALNSLKNAVAELKEL